MPQAVINSSGNFPKIAMFREIKALIYISAAIYLFISLNSYSAADPAWSFTSEKASILNNGGVIGAWIADIIFSMFGYVAYLFSPAIAYCVVFQYQENPPKILSWLVKIFGFALATCCLAALTNINFEYAYFDLPMSSGGIVGAVLQEIIIAELNSLGADILLACGAVIGTVMYTGKSFLRFIRLNFRVLKLCASKVIKATAVALIVVYEFSARIIQKLRGNRYNDKENQDKNIVIQRHENNNEDSEMKMQYLSDKQEEHNSFDDDQNADLSQDEISTMSDYENSYSDNYNNEDDEDSEDDEYSSEWESDGEVSMEDEIEEDIPYQAPSLENLNEVPEDIEQESEEELLIVSTNLEERLLEFGVEVKVVSVHPGPVITRFELELAPGLKVSKITGLAKDLARALSVVSVRVVEIIPGKSVIGLELPNKNRQTVFLKEILEADNYKHASSSLSLGLGKNIAGVPVSVDLARMPHLLVAGTTGAGKSVALNAMLLSLLYKATPEQVRMILIDPKMLELSVYADIPHLLTPVVTDMKEAAGALKWCVKEMERRYKLMAESGVRNLEGYNKKLQEETSFLEGSESLPHIVVIIDELADMMMTVGKKVEELIARISQKARAAGIHLILATQRPSVDVITGLIKANIPARIAFQVSSKIDSRTILDTSGAEQLLGSGDMLYQAPGMNVPIRIHGAFVRDEEVHKVVEDLKRNSKPKYIEEVANSFSANSLEFDEDQDELYEDAVQIVLDSKKASISNVQRRLKIGYNRAARLLETMEERGIVSPMESNGSREILINNDSYQ